MDFFAQPGCSPIIDQHAHNLLKPAVAANSPYPACFTEAHDAEYASTGTRHTLCYRRSLREIAALLDCAPAEESILAQRASLGLERLTELCFSAGKIETILLDDGFLPDDILSLEDNLFWVAGVATPINKILCWIYRTLRWSVSIVLYLFFCGRFTGGFTDHGLLSKKGKLERVRLAILNSPNYAPK